MVEDGKEAVGSMGDDTPLAVLSRHLSRLHHFFRQNFSQVTNPPIDSLRERRVMSLQDAVRQPRQHPRRGPEPEPRCCSWRVPVAAQRRVRGDARATWARPAARIDCTFDPAGRAGRHAPGLRAHPRTRPRRPCARGCRHIVLTDATSSADARGDADDPGGRRRCTPTWCARALRTFTSLNVRSAECLDVHYFAVLIGVGATTVNAYLAEETHRRPPRARPVRQARRSASASPTTRRRSTRACSRSCPRWASRCISSYRGGCNFEAVGLSRALVRGVLPRHAVAHLRHRPARHRRRRSPSCTRRAFDADASRRCRSAASTRYAARRRDARLRGAA